MKSEIKHLLIGSVIGAVACLLVMWRVSSGGDSGEYRWPDLVVRTDTLRVEGPINYIDRWHERIVYVEQEPDTVQVIVYEYPVPTIQFAGGTLREDGTALIQVAVNDTMTVLLEGRMAGSGDTHIVVNPDSSVSFVHNRFGFDPSLVGGFGLYGVEVGCETFYWNDVPLLHTTLHGPNLTFKIPWSVIRDEGTGSAVGADVSLEISPFRTPARWTLGTTFKIPDQEFEFGSAIMFEMWDF